MATFDAEDFKNSNFSFPVLRAERIILIDATSEAQTINLPDASRFIHNCYVIKKLNEIGNNVTVTTTNGQTIDGLTSRVLNGTDRPAMKVWSDGVEWHII